MKIKLLKRDNNEMNIVFGCNKEYAKYVLVMLQSLFESNAEHFINLYAMIEEGLGEWRDKIEYVVKKYGNEIQFIKLPQNSRENEIKKFWPTPINIDRYLAINLLPENVERFLMLDVDILVRGDLREWYDSDFGDKYLIMCRDMAIMSWCDSTEEWAINLQNKVGRLDKNYGNSGVVLVSCDIKKIFNYHSMIDVIIKEQYSMPEQDYFNINMKEYIKLIEPYEYNYIAGLGNYEEAIEKVKILHYPLFKPWKAYDGTPWMKLWIECVQRTPGCEEIIQDHENYVNDSRYISWKYHSRYHILLDNWMELRAEGYNILDRKNYSSIALYGAGRMCGHLLSDLEKSNVQCRGIYDKDEKLNEIKGILIYHNLDTYLKDIGDVDVIIVTAISFYDEIKCFLEKKTTLKIVSLEEIVRGEE